MAISKTAKKNSLFRTTLTASMQTSSTDMTLDDVPSGDVQYPNWLVIEPNSANAEIVYLPTAPSTNTYSSIVRNISQVSDSDAGSTGIAHSAGVEVVMALTHRDWNEVVSIIQGTNGTGYNSLRLGDETDSNITLYAQNADASKPFLRYDAASNKWLISNDGTSTYDISAGGSGLTRGAGVDIVGSAITLDTRTSGGLRNNQGTGSVQADVDPAIVARLDTANTWGAVQTFTADQAQITSDADSANDAVRKSYMDLRIALGAVSGTSGEAIDAGQGLYMKASDGKLYKAIGTSDEAAFKFVGIALETVGAADTAITYAPPGHTVTGLSGLTAGSYYFVTDTAGTLGTTPGTRFARVAMAISTTALQVVTPKYVNRGSFTVTATGDTSVTVGFRSAKILIRAGSNSGGAGGMGISSVGGLGNNCVMNAGPGTGAGALGYDASNAARLQSTTAGTTVNVLAGTISAQTATGFTFNTSVFNVAGGNYSNPVVFWEAESL